MRENRILFYLLFVILYSCNTDDSVCLSNKVEVHNNSIDSVMVYYKQKNKICYDCSNYCEIFVSLYNNTDTIKKFLFYFNENNSAKTNFYIKYKAEIFELYGNDANPIVIDKKGKHNIVLSLSNNFLIKDDSLNYSSFIDEIFNKGSLIYINSKMKIKADTIVISKSPNMKFVHSMRP
jgi:hypothetical protein